MYKLNTESSTVKFYEWIWNTNITKFKTMCPYFWLYVLTVLFIPVILPCKLVGYLLPAKKVSNAFDYIEASKTGEFISSITKPNRFWYVVGTILKWMFFGVAGVILLAGLILAVIALWNNPKEGFTALGVIVVSALFIVGIIYAFEEYNLGYKIGTPFRFIGNMISSLYNQACPLIKWN